MMTNDETQREEVKPPMKYVCKWCGSDDITLEGYITWCVEDQVYEVGEIANSGHYCATCDGECRVDWVPA